MTRKNKEQETVSICTVVSFEKSSRCGLKIAMAHTVGSRVTLTTLGVGRKGGMTFTPNQNLKKMLETNGTKAIEVTKENGND
jgi:enterochelin esterase-like enzyme